jgi:hypothetical protein
MTRFVCQRWRYCSVRCVSPLGIDPSGSDESRLTPPAPDAQPGATAPARPPAGPTPQALRARIEADTLAAGSALRRCTGRQLLAEQESTVESATRLLEETRAALTAGDLAHAESLARQARQLTRSLDCP